MRERAGGTTDVDVDPATLAQLTAQLMLQGQARLTDLAAQLHLTVDEVRSALANITGGLAAAGVVVIDDGTRVHISGHPPGLAAGARRSEDSTVIGNAVFGTPGATRRLVSPVIVHREAELAALLEAANHVPSLTLIEGEAGVGKTRLTAEFLARPELAGMRRLVGRCHPLREPFAYGPVLEAVRGVRDLGRIRGLSPLAGVLRTVLPEFAQDLPELPERVGAHPDRQLIVRALVELLSHLGPTVLLLEDVHWADVGTLDLIRYLAARLPPELAVVATYRAEPVRAAFALRELVARAPAGVSAVTVPLAPLSSAGVRELISAILGTAEVSDAVAQLVHARTAGLPIAVEEVVRLMQEHPDLARRSDSWSRRVLEAMSIPPTIQDSVMERAARLNPESRRLVDAAAILGVPVPLDTLGHVAGVPAGRRLAALRTAADASLLVEVEPDGFGFRHPLAARAVYDAIPRQERVRVHLRAARILETTTPRPAAQLARHYRAAGRTRQWLLHAEAAADAASAQGNDAGAALLLLEALGAQPSAATSAALAVKLARAALSSHAYRQEAMSVVSELLAARGLPRPARGHLRGLLGMLYIEGGDATAGYKQLTRSVPDLAAVPGTATLVMGSLALPWVVEGTAAAHRRWLQQAMVTAAKVEDPSLTLTMQGFRALIPVYLGDPDGWRLAQNLPTSSASIAEERQLLWLASHLVGACFYLGHYRRAREFAARADELAGSLGWDRYLALRQIAVLMLDWAAGSWAGLDTRAAGQVELMAADFPPGAVLAKLTGALIALAQGASSTAERDLLACAAAARSSGLIPALAMAAGGVTRAELSRGDAAAARDRAMEAVTVVADKGIWVWASDVAPVAVEALIACGDPGAARRLTADFSRGVASSDAPLAHAAVTMCRGLLAEAAGRFTSAADEFEAAASAYTALPRPFEAALASARAGEHMLNVGRGDGAATLLTAWRELDRLGAAAHLPRLVQLMRRRSIPLPSTRRGQPRGYGGALSPRERDVAELAARGQRTAEIAAALFVSPKTVESHLGAVMRKLGVHTRAQLAVRWALDAPRDESDVARERDIRGNT